ncbi:MAG TPA: fructose-6-phosphate aldolase [Acidobacteriota bacterium]|jgi:transaldolase|nr:fructose-6-phosphate aldolase [Acidobacteriota bacterium]HNR37601.1 fructose-6-phosphate aldolase [Acidobacteriota bacterium]HNT99107.1 fructose-6-phosphate aldolase [Acidobacteriota bacterium]HQO24706.1 fructose-6-phosphate aldolase [Acidobacteriota bacterium]HQP73231.1 fructose-6-phosphate aldolase [Acidobacteriota bacterium]
MKFFLDTANLEEIRQAASMGLIDGVTTNPSLIAKEKGDFRDLLRQICAAVPGPISAEVVALDAAGMLKEGRELAKIADNITVKVPVTLEGLKAVRAFSAEKIKTNVTLIFSPLQALMAAKAGATFVSPFVGRLDDVGASGMDVVNQIVEIYENYGFTTEVLVASIRHPMHVVEAALMGADVATMPWKVLQQLIQHPLTDIGIQRFLDDWKKLPGNTIA